MQQLPPIFDTAPKPVATAAGEYRAARERLLAAHDAVRSTARAEREAQSARDAEVAAAVKRGDALPADDKVREAIEAAKLAREAVPIAERQCDAAAGAVVKAAAENADEWLAQLAASRPEAIDAVREAATVLAGNIGALGDHLAVVDWVARATRTFHDASALNRIPALRAPESHLGPANPLGTIEKFADWLDAGLAEAPYRRQWGNEKPDAA